MVAFGKLLASAAALAVPISAVLTSAQIVDTIQVLTAKSETLQLPAQSITLVNAPLIIFGLGPLPPIIAGFVDIVTTATLAIAQIPGTPPVPAGVSSDAIFNAFREFVRVHQALLNILIGKAGLFTTVPIIGAPVAAILRQIENVVDTIAYGLISLVQSRAAELTLEARSLSASIKIAITSYGGISLGKREEARPLRFARGEAVAAVSA